MTIARQLEDPKVAGEVSKLALLIRETNRSLLAFALYRSAGEREVAVRVLKERLNLPVIEFTLSAEQRDPVRLLLEVPMEPRACVFYYDLEASLPDVAGYANLQREQFAEVPHAEVFWVTEHGLRQIGTLAPDFWSWRSGVFDLRSNQAESSFQVMQSVLAEPLNFRDRGDLDRQISMYQGLIQEYSQQDPPDDRFLAGLQLRLASAFRLLGRIEQAEDHAREALVRCQRAGDKGAEASALHELGISALERWRLDEAEALHRQGLTISEQVGDEAGMATSYHDLGRVAELRQELDEAEQWYRKALGIYERLGLERDASDEYHYLGMVAHERGQLDRAEQWYRKALETFERLGLERHAAHGYHNLGLIAEDRLQLDQAEQWYRKALEIFERLGLELGAATEYHHLGIVAQERNQLDRAEQWYRRALEAYELVGQPPFLADTLAQLGILRQQQNRFHEAVSCYGRALAIATEYHLPHREQILVHLAGLRHEMDEAEFARAWRQAFGDQEPPLEALREIARQRASGA